MSKSILQIIYSCSVQKIARKKTKYSRNETILKIGYHAKAISIQNPYFDSKIKIAKHMSKFILEINYNCSVQKPISEKDQISEK